MRALRWISSVAPALLVTACMSFDFSGGSSSSSGCEPAPACPDALHASGMLDHAGACDYACDPGWAACGKKVPAADGCDQDVSHDDDNCGGCGLSCAAGLHCNAGSCQAVTDIDEALNVRDIALRGGHVILAGDTLLDVAPDHTVTRPTQTLASAAVADVAGVYWVDGAHGSVPIDDTDIRSLAFGQPERVLATGKPIAQLAESPADLYWMDWDGDKQITIRRTPKIGGTTEPVATMGLTVCFWGSSCDADASSYYLLDGREMDVGGGYLYFADIEASAIRRQPIDGGPVETVVTGVRPDTLHAASDGLYYATDHALMRWREGDAAPEHLVDATVSAITSDDGAFYYASTDWVIHRRYKDSLRETALAGRQQGVIDMAVDGDTVYWVTRKLLRGASTRLNQ